MKVVILVSFYISFLFSGSLVEVTDMFLNIRYASSDNFVGTKIDGYEASKCLLTKEAYTQLKEVEQELNKEKLHLLIYDCYRPTRAVDHFVRWAKDLEDTKMKVQYYPNVKKSELFEKGYIAHRSAHSRGSTVDVAIAELDFGTPYDYFDETSHTFSKEVSEEAQKNRLYLHNIMSKYGFKSLDEEWWHFTLMYEANKNRYYDKVIK